MKINGIVAEFLSPALKSLALLVPNARLVVVLRDVFLAFSPVFALLNSGSHWQLVYLWRLAYRLGCLLPLSRQRRFLKKNFSAHAVVEFSSPAPKSLALFDRNVRLVFVLREVF